MKENILQVSLEPATLVVNHPNKLIFRLTNTSDRFCSNIVFFPTFPNHLVSLKGMDRLEVAHLGAGESIIYEFLVNPKDIGEWAITSRNFSYRDGYGQSRRITDLQLLIHVKEMVEVPVKTIEKEPKANISLNPISDEKSSPSKSHFADLNSLKKILILSSNPKMTSQLRLDEEVREIDEGLRRSKHRDRFEIYTKLAVRLRDLRRALLDVEPNIVHFSGHGKEDGLLLVDELGMAACISAEALAGLFSLCSDQVACVILNACYSAPQATAINKHIPYVIGMQKEIKDKAAIEFTVGFYDALGAGRTVSDAFEFGRNAVLQMYPDQNEHLIPILKNK